MPVYTSANIVSVSDDSVSVEYNGTQKEIPAELIITSIGYNKGVSFDLEAAGKKVYTIGDANHIANLMNAVYQANDLALKFSK